MKRIFLLLACFLMGIGLYLGAIHPEFAKKHSSLLILNHKTKGNIPQKFRMTPFNSSGSAQFSAVELKYILKQIPTSQVILVDLREESHGFLNGNALSWYVHRNWINIGKPKETIIEEEAQLFEDLSKRNLVVVYHHKQYPVPHFVRSVKTEEELAQSHHVCYYRLPLADHRRPKDERVDEWIAFYKKLPKSTWIHFHCSAGMGRTTTLMVMHDIMLNAVEDSLEEIVSRQNEYGGINLFSLPEEKEWYFPLFQDRIAFIKKFYQYCREVPEFDRTWSEWSRTL